MSSNYMEWSLWESQYVMRNLYIEKETTLHVWTVCHLNFEFSHYILQVMIILEFMSNGDLRDFLIENRPRYLTLCSYFVINYIYISIPFCINYKVMKALTILGSHPWVKWLRITLFQMRSSFPLVQERWQLLKYQSFAWNWAVRLLLGWSTFPASLSFTGISLLETYFYLQK